MNVDVDRAKRDWAAFSAGRTGMKPSELLAMLRAERELKSLPEQPVFEEPPFRCAQSLATRTALLSALVLLVAGLVFWWRV